jgi:hypothetical protein
MAVLLGSTERMVGMAFRVIIFGVFLWGTVIVLAGHFILLHPFRRVGSLFEQVVHPSGVNQPVTVTGYDELIGDPSHFVLDPSWDIHAPPTTRVYNWSVSFHHMCCREWLKLVFLAAVSEIWGRPGHISKRMLVVNGISPGPTIEANFGDRIIVRLPTIHTSLSVSAHQKVSYIGPCCQSTTE